MLMKKRLCLIASGILFVMAVQAQFYYARLGVGVSAGTSSNLDLLYSYSTSSAGRMVTVVPVGFGRGFTGVAAFGFSPTKNISLELGISQLVGFPKYADSVVRLPGGATNEAFVKGNMLSLVPAVVIKPGFEKVDPYARIGFILGIRPVVNATAEYTNSSVNPAEEYTMVRHFYGGVAAGFSGALGVNYYISDLVTFFAEVSFNSINYSPKRSEVILFEKNGEDMLYTLTEKQKKTEYYNNVYPDEQIPDTSPNKALRKSLPFSNAGINFGVMFNF